MSERADCPKNVDTDRAHADAIRRAVKLVNDVVASAKQDKLKVRLHLDVLDEIKVLEITRAL